MADRFRKGQRLTWRCIDGQLVTVYVIKPGRFLSLVTYRVEEFWASPGDLGPPRRVVKWRWNHRLFAWP